MIHLSQFIQVRNPMKNMKNCLNSTKTLENNNCKIFIFLFPVCKNSKTTKQKNIARQKTENREQQQKQNNIQIQLQKNIQNNIQLNRKRKQIHRKTKIENKENNNRNNTNRKQKINIDSKTKMEKTEKPKTDIIFSKLSPTLEMHIVLNMNMY